MNLQHVNVKLPAEGAWNVELERFIETFHSWVSSQSMDELLVDVADYRHVPEGPGVLLVGHEADYAISSTGGRWGLVYNRKAPLDGTNQDRFRQALAAAAQAGLRLEADFPSLRFSRTEFDLMVNDRALAPNTPETFDACRLELDSFASSDLDQSDFRVEHHADPRRLFGVTFHLASPLDLQTAARL